MCVVQLVIQRVLHGDPELQAHILKVLREVVDKASQYKRVAFVFLKWALLEMLDPETNRLRQLTPEEWKTVVHDAYEGAFKQALSTTVCSCARTIVVNVPSCTQCSSDIIN